MLKKIRKIQYKDVTKIVKQQPKMIKEMIRLPKNIIERESIKDLKKFVKQTRFQLSPDQKSIVKKLRHPKKQARRHPKRKPSKDYFCSVSGNPHFKTFYGEKFNSIKQGDFLLVKGRNFEVHTRQKKWGGAAVNTKFSTRVNKKGDKFQINSKKHILVNGQKRNIRVGETVVAPNGGYIKRITASRFKVESIDGSYVDATVKKAKLFHYIDILIFTRKMKGLTGVCVSRKEFTATGLFKHPKPATKVKRGVCILPQENEAKVKCSEANISQIHMKACIKEVCLSGGKLDPKHFHKYQELIKKDQKRQKEIEKIQREITKENQIRKATQGHFCRFNGDPHASTFKGKLFDNYKQGDFVLVKGKEFEVHTRQRKWGGAAVNERFIAKLNKEGDKVEVINRNHVIINGRSLKFTVGRTIHLPNGGRVTRYSRSSFKLEATDGSYVDSRINVEPKLKAWPREHYIDIAIFVPKSKGLTGFCAGPRELPAQGLFNTQFEIRSIPEQKFTKKTKKRSKKNM